MEESIREIKFRARDILDKGWHYGSLVKDEILKGYYIIDNEYGTEIDVIQKTIGQYTGLKDKNGKEIYEGDICYSEKEEENVEIAYDIEMAMYTIVGTVHIDNFDNYENSELLTVIGNIYDNSELLEEE